MPRPLRIAAVVCAASLASASASFAGRTSRDVYEARAHRVDLAAPAQSAAAPVAGEGWSYGAEIPYSARQADLTLRQGDPLAVWFPSSRYSGGIGGDRVYLDRMPEVDLATNTVTLNRYYRLEHYYSLLVLVGSSESSYWIGSLPAGDYEFVLNDWRLPGIESSSDPLAGLAGTSNLTTPWSLDIPKATLTRANRWAFTVVPEPTTGLLAMLALPAAACRRH